MKFKKLCMLYGFMTWLIPFIVAIFFYSKDGILKIDIFLFKSIMLLVGFAVGAFFLNLYFKKLNENYFRESIAIGLSWLTLNLLLDVLILIPISGMNTQDYIYQIGLRYLIIPIYSVSLGAFAKIKK